MRAGFDKEWLDRAKMETDPFHKFVSAYIVFNYHYARYNPRNGDHRNAVDFGVDKCEQIPFNPFGLDVSEFLRRPVTDMAPSNGAPRVVHVIEGDVRQLFEAIYQVRCNFFHGNKDFNSDRDTKLVAQGANVLIALMDRIVY